MCRKIFIHVRTSVVFNFLLFLIFKQQHFNCVTNTSINARNKSQLFLRQHMLLINNAAQFRLSHTSFIVQHFYKRVLVCVFTLAYSHTWWNLTQRLQISLSFLSSYHIMWATLQECSNKTHLVLNNKIILSNQDLPN